MSGSSDDGVEVTYKVLLLGESGVGKTALIQRLVNRAFSYSYMSTIGIDFVKKVFDVDGAKVRLEIWDTAGQERFRTFTRAQYRGTTGLVLVYDVTCRDTFDMLNYWLHSFQEIADTDMKNPIPVFILGNKEDLSEQRSVSTKEGKKISNFHLARGFLETSAKTGRNIEEAFYRLAHVITSTYHPKLMNAYLNPAERRMRAESRSGSKTCEAPPSQPDECDVKILLGSTNNEAHEKRCCKS